MPTAFSYVRFSTGRQVLGDSLRRQIQGSRDWCIRNGFTLDESFRLKDLGVSAFRGKNAKVGALGAFLDAVKADRIPTGSVLIVESLDRLSRDLLRPALRLFMDIIESGVDIVTLVPERRHTLDSSNDVVGMLEPIFVMSRANEESAIKSHRGEAVWRQRRKQAREGKAATPCPPWWISRVDGAYQPIPDRVAVVRQMYELKTRGYGLYRICGQLNTDPTLPKPMGGGSWNQSTVRNYLLSRTVLGEYRPQRIVEGRKVPEGEPIRGYYPAVISEELYHQAQAAWKVRTRGRQPLGDLVNLFTGLLFSGNDGSAVYQISNVNIRKGVRYVYRDLLSSAAHNNVEGACRVRVRYSTFETAFLRYTREIKPSDFARDKGAIHDEIGKVSGELAETEHTLRISQTRFKEARGAAKEVWADTISATDAERLVLVSRLDALKSVASSAEVDAVGDLRSLADLLETAEPDAATDLRIQIRSRINQLIEKIVMTPVVRPGNLQRNRVKFFCDVEIHFRDGHKRIYCFTDGGKLWPCRYSAEEVEAMLLK